MRAGPSLTAFAPVYARFAGDDLAYLRHDVHGRPRLSGARRARRHHHAHLCVRRLTTRITSAGATPREARVMPHLCGAASMLSDVHRPASIRKHAAEYGLSCCSILQLRAAMRWHFVSGSGGCADDAPESDVRSRVMVSVDLEVQATSGVTGKGRTMQPRRTRSKNGLSTHFSSRCRRTWIVNTSSYDASSSTRP